MGQPAQWDQDSFRGYADDDVEGSATPKAATNIDWSQAVDANFRVRFLVDNYGATDGSIGALFQYNHNTTTWIDITESSSVVRSVASPHFADEDATTQQVGSGTFNAGKFDDADGTGGITTAVSVPAGQETEFELVIQIRSADVSNNDQVELRCVDLGRTAYNLYTSTPSITVVETAGYSITGDVTVGVTVAAAMDYDLNASIDGAVSIPITVGATMDYTLNASIVGAVTVAVGVAAAMDYDLNASIDGAVSVPLSVAATMEYSEPSPEIIGDVTVTIAVASTMDYSNPGAEIVGDITVTLDVAAAMDYTLNASIAGAVSVPSVVAAVMAYNLNASIVGSVAVPIAVASTLDYTLNASIDGAVSIPITVASVMEYTAGGFEIVGDITVSVVVAAAMQYNLNASIVGDVQVPVTVASTMDYTLNASISGSVTVQITPTAGMLYNLHASILGDITIPIGVASGMYWTTPGPPGLWDRTLFDRGLFDEPGSIVSEAATTTSGIMGLIVELSGESDASLVVTLGDLTKVGFPDVGTKELRQMPWSRIS